MDVFFKSAIIACVLFLIIAGITWFIGWIDGDSDYKMRWLFTCALFAVTIAAFIMIYNT